LRIGDDVIQRRTLARETVLEGVGLHTGRTVRLTLVPAPAEHGVVFERTDLGARIPATLDHAGRAFYATVLERDGASVSTVEHLLAALYALQVDDVLVRLDGPEVPILDGSARPFVDAILGAGRVELPVSRRYIHLVRPVAVERDDKRIAAHPAADFRVTYAIDFDHPMLGYQELTVGLWDENAFTAKLASARTFTFERDVEALRQSGLARGGSLDNAVVLGDSEVLNADLRFPDEFVRHKILDLTGDLALLGHPLRAHVVAYRAGHDLHGELARLIARRRDCWHLSPWSERPVDADAPTER
jgi:UDP-3-O-[3-hydroxymyristoyl] N-acetylglucosamine deacetylase